MATGKVNVSGGGNNKLNIYCQTTQPSKKEGIWLKINAPYSNVVLDSKYYLANTWVNNNLGIYANIPYDFTKGGAVTVGTDIYLLGGTGAPNYNYKYNTLTNTYTKLTNIPYPFYNGSAVAVGTDIYLFSSSDSATYFKYAYKYSTLTDTYTKLTDMPYDFANGSTAVAIGNSIYILGCQMNPSYAYRYNISGNSYTKLKDIPYYFANGSTVVVGADIYLLGGTGVSNYNYKYNTLTNTYTKLTDIPYPFYNGSAVAVGTDIYLLGSGSSTLYPKYFYKYNTLTDTYTKLTDIPYDFSNGCAVMLNGKIFALGGNFYAFYVKVFTFNSKQYEENTLILSRSDVTQGTYYTELLSPKKRPSGLFNRFPVGFNDALLFRNGDLETPSSYYGDGSKWVQFRV